MKTLTQLKNDLQIGSEMTLTYHHFNNERTNKLLNIPRYIIKKNTVGICLNADKNAKSGSFLDYPKFSLMEYNDDELKMYGIGTRPLTSNEQRIFDNKPSSRPENAERIEMEMMTDTHGSYYLDKAYFADNDMKYLFYEKSKGLYYSNGEILDDSIKGKLELVYKLSNIK